MPSNELTTKLQQVADMIQVVRGQRVILDSDLAVVYGVPTKALNQAVKRNHAKFPQDFIFRLTSEEAEECRRLRSQIVTLKRGQHIKYLPYAFTEHGAIMAATVLNSPRAVQMSVFVVRAFVKMRSMLMAQKDFAKKLAELEKKLTERLDLHERTISDIIQQIMLMLNPPPEPEPPRKMIGFQVRERGAVYRVRTGRKGRKP
jgi:phage regulator Rha-like protein